MNLEEITWIDSGKLWTANWHGIEWIIEQAKAWTGSNTTVGYVIYEDERVVLLAQTLDDEANNVAGIFLIHVPSITERKIYNGR